MGDEGWLGDCLCQVVRGKAAVAFSSQPLWVVLFCFVSYDVVRIRAHDRRAHTGLRRLCRHLDRFAPLVCLFLLFAALSCSLGAWLSVALYNVGGFFCRLFSFNFSKVENIRR